MTIQARTGGEGKDDYAAREPAGLSEKLSIARGMSLTSSCKAPSASRAGRLHPWSLSAD